MVGRAHVALVAGLAACTAGDSTTDAPGIDVELSEASWRLHEDYGTLAYVSWTQSASSEVTVEYRVDEGTWRSTRPLAARPGFHEQILVGLPYAHTVDWRIVAGSTTLEGADPIVTAELPSGLPVGELRTAEPERWLPEGNYLLTSISQRNGGWGTEGPFFTLLLDRRGRVVWSRRTARGNWTLYPTVARSGDHLLYDDFGPFFGTATLYRATLDDVIEEIPIPGFHHAFVELPDGTIAWDSWADGLVELRPGDKQGTSIWNCEDDWPESDVGGGYYYGCASNCVFYDDERETYLISYYSNETVVEIDRKTGSTMWWAGGVDGGYDFVPANTQFYWQHGVTWTDAGTLLVSTHSANRNTNLAREYEVDHEAGTLTEVWSYDAQALAATNGDTWRLSNGNTLHTLGSASQVLEVDENGETVWHLDFNGTRLMGRSEWIDDPYALVGHRAEPKPPG